MPGICHGGAELKYKRWLFHAGLLQQCLCCLIPLEALSMKVLSLLAAVAAVVRGQDVFISTTGYTARPQCTKPPATPTYSFQGFSYVALHDTVRYASYERTSAINMLSSLTKLQQVRYLCPVSNHHSEIWSRLFRGFRKAID